MAVHAEAAPGNASMMPAGVHAVLQRALHIQAQQERLQREQSERQREQSELQREQSEVLRLALAALLGPVSQAGTVDPVVVDAAAFTGGSTSPRPAWPTSSRPGLATAEGRSSDPQVHASEPDAAPLDSEYDATETALQAEFLDVFHMQDAHIDPYAAPGALLGTVPLGAGRATINMGRSLTGQLVAPMRTQVTWDTRTSTSWARRLGRLQRHATVASRMSSRTSGLPSASHQLNTLTFDNAAPDLSIALRQAAHVAGSTAQEQGLLRARARIQGGLALRAVSGSCTNAATLTAGSNRAHASDASGADVGTACAHASQSLPQIVLVTGDRAGHRMSQADWRQAIILGCASVAEAVRLHEQRSVNPGPCRTGSLRDSSALHTSESAGPDTGFGKHSSRSARSFASTADASKRTSPCASASASDVSEPEGHHGPRERKGAARLNVGFNETTTRFHKFGSLRAMSTDLSLDVKESSCTGSKIYHVLLGVLQMHENPDASIRALWDVIVLVLMCVVVVVVPYTVAFEHTSVVGDDGTVSGWFCVLLAVDFFFVLDMYQQSRMTYFDDEFVEVTSRWRIFLHYLRTWFIFDLVSVLPFDQLLESQSSRLFTLSKSAKMARLTKVLRVVKILKMLRLLRASDVISRITSTIGRPMGNLLRIMGLAVLLLHSVACMFHFFAVVVPPPEEDYVDVFGRSTWLHANDLTERSEGERYLAALYWAFGTLSTVAYGDITPMSNLEISFSMLVMALGLSVFSYFFASVAQVVKTFNAPQNKVTNVMEEVDMMLTGHCIPSALAKRVREYFLHCAEQNVMAQDFSLMQHLTGQLHQDMLLHLFKDLFTSVPFLASKGPAFVLELVQVLTMKVYAPQEFIITQGDLVLSMFFIHEGELEELVAVNKAVFTREVLHARMRLVERRGSDAKRRPMSLSQTRQQSGSVQKPIKRSWREWLRGDGHVNKKKPISVLDIVSKRLYEVVPPMLGPGDHFGEQGCLSASKRSPTSIVTRSFCKIMELNACDLEDLVHLFGADDDFDAETPLSEVKRSRVEQEQQIERESSESDGLASDDGLTFRPSHINWDDRAGLVKKATTLNDAVTAMRASALSRGSDKLLPDPGRRSQHSARLVRASAESTSSRSPPAWCARRSHHGTVPKRPRNNLCSEPALCKLTPTSLRHTTSRPLMSTTSDFENVEGTSSGSSAGVVVAEPRRRSLQSYFPSSFKSKVKRAKRRKQLGRTNTGSVIGKEKKPTYAGVECEAMIERPAASMSE